MMNAFNQKIENFRKSKTDFQTINRIELKSIGLSYLAGDEAGTDQVSQKVVFKDLNYNFDLDQNVLFEGRLGSGRSSLMKLLAGLLMPTTGSYFINDCDVTKMSFEEFLPYRLFIGYAFDYGGLLANRSLKDNLLIPLIYHALLTPSEAEARVKQMIDIFKITGHENQRPASVSGAMRKATVVARSFILRPELLILDDPFVGLDDEQGKNIVDLILEHRKSYGLRHVFYSTRYERFVSMLGGKSLVLSNSQLISSDLDPARRAA